MASNCRMQRIVTPDFKHHVIYDAVPSKFCTFDQQMAKQNFNIVLVGAGNVATHLGRAWHKAGINILQVYSRNHTSASALARKINATPLSNPAEIDAAADAVIFSLRDNSYLSVLEKVDLHGTLLLHTSGSLDMGILSAASNRIGVIYPLQTFNKHKILDLSQTPFLLEAESDADMPLIEKLAALITGNIVHISSEQRATLHVSAVFSCNFVNYLYTIAEDLLKAKNLDIDLIRPLILETAQKVMTESPSEVQTGPAKRNDTKIITKHLESLYNNPEYRELYKNLTEKIINRNKESFKNDKL